jgi:hypothetical protein
MLVTLLSIFSNPLAAQSELGQKMEFLKSSSGTLEARWSKLNALQKAAAYIKRITPFYSWINLCTAVEVDEKSFLMGDCLQDEGDAVFIRPTDQFRSEYSAAIEQLWSRNELDAMTFANVVRGEATDARYLKNMISIAQLIAVGIVGFVFLKRFNFSRFGWMSAIGWTNMKRAFFVSVTVWLLGGAALQIIGNVSGFSITLMNIQTLVFVVFGGLSIILGIFLLGGWLWNRNAQY